MKKSLLKIASVCIAAVLSLGAFASCGLFEVDSDRDMAQKVATVQINKTVDATDIYKKDLISGYVSYGYNYVQNYSYTTSEAYKLVLDNLVNSAVIVQQSRYEIANNYAAEEKYASALPSLDERAALLNNLYNDGYLYLFASDKEKEEFKKTEAGKKNAEYSASYTAALNDYIYNLYKGKTDLGANYDAFMFIFEKDAYSAIANAIDNANSLIDTYVSSSDDEEEYENITYTARTVPEKEEEEEDDAELLKGYKEKFIDFSGERSTAFIKVKDRLANLYLIGSEENVDLKETKYILAYSYFTSLVKSSAEAAIVAVYEQALKNMAGIDYTTATAGEKNNLWEQYVALQNKQKAQYTGDISSFETQLSAVGDSSFVAYVPSAGYFYVSHLLIGYTDEQKALVETITSQQGKTEEEIQEEINALAESMVIEDQRASWVLSNYGTYDGQTFRFSDKYLYDADGDLAVFKGTIGGAKAYTAKDDEGNDVNKFSFSNVVADKLTYGEFIGFATKAITGEEGDLVLDTVFGGSDAKRIDKEAFNRFEDLKFAFSTDTGNFNNYLGYAYSPITSKSQYVSAFYKACEKIGKEENKVGAYVMFMSQEYGLHIVLCTATADFGVYENTVDGKAAFEADLEDEESVAYLFMKAQLDLVSSSYINDIAQSFISEYTAEGAKIAGTSDLIVTYYEKAYNDLITE